jgi:hypothetical protein
MQIRRAHHPPLRHTRSQPQFTTFVSLRSRGLGTAGPAGSITFGDTAEGDLAASDDRDRSRPPGNTGPLCRSLLPDSGCIRKMAAFPARAPRPGPPAANARQPRPGPPPRLPCRPRPRGTARTAGRPHGEGTPGSAVHLKREHAASAARSHPWKADGQGFWQVQRPVDERRPGPGNIGQVDRDLRVLHPQTRGRALPNPRRVASLGPSAMFGRGRHVRTKGRSGVENERGRGCLRADRGR